MPCQRLADFFKLPDGRYFNLTNVSSVVFYEQTVNGERLVAYGYGLTLERCFRLVDADADALRQALDARSRQGDNAR